MYFRDEDFRRLSHSALTQPVVDRIARILHLGIRFSHVSCFRLTRYTGIKLGERLFEFLAYSSSQLRDHCCWFFLGTIDVSVHDVQQWMGFIYRFIHCFYLMLCR